MHWKSHSFVGLWFVADDEQRRRIYSRTDFPSLSFSLGGAAAARSSPASLSKCSSQVASLFWSDQLPLLSTTDICFDHALPLLCSFIYISRFSCGVLCCAMTGFPLSPVSCNQKNVIISLFGIGNNCCYYYYYYTGGLRSTTTVHKIGKTRWELLMQCNAIWTASCIAFEINRERGRYTCNEGMDILTARLHANCWGGSLRVSNSPEGLSYLISLIIPLFFNYIHVPSLSLRLNTDQCFAVSSP